MFSCFSVLHMSSDYLYLTSLRHVAERPPPPGFGSFMGFSVDEFPWLDV